MYYVVYRLSDGMILSSGQCQTMAQVNAHAQANVSAVLQVDAGISAQKYYIANSSPVAYSNTVAAVVNSPPGPNYTFSPTQGWVDGRTLAQAQAQAIARLTAARDALEYANFTYNGVTYAADADSQRRISGAVQLALIAQAAGQSFSITWLDINNNPVTLTGDQLIALGQALGAAVISAFSSFTTAVSAVNSATTNAQADAVTL